MPLWNITKTIKYGRYIRAVLPEHPNSSKRGYIALHRVLMENKLGRLLENNEVIHHINGDGQDNNIENLQVMTRSDHMKLHRSLLIKNKKWGVLTKYVCSGCGNVFERPFRNRDQKCKHFCSSRCVAENASKFRKYKVNII